MTESLEIRETTQADGPAIESLYPEAFPDEDLVPLVRDLSQDPAITISLVGEIDSRIVGHAIFTFCGVVGSDIRAALLGPLAVAPAWQGRGIGSTIVRTGLQRLEDAGISQVFVLGDPAYYGRFGFLPESRVSPPYPLPAEWDGAWQSKLLRRTTTPSRGELDLPRAWRQPALWAP